MKKPGITRCSGAADLNIFLPKGVTMPSKPNIPCKHPGCPILIPYGSKYCEAHKKLHPKATRSATARGYGAAWQRESRRFLVYTEITAFPAIRHTYLAGVYPLTLAGIVITILYLIDHMSERKIENG